MLFISHDLAIVEHMTHRVAVMYLGRIVETGPKAALFARPMHPYTEALLSAVPVPDPVAKRQRIILGGDVPSPVKPPPGCHFPARCRYAFDRCRTQVPLSRTVGEGHLAACHLHDRPPADNPLFRLPNVILTPHFAGPTWDNQQARFRNAFDNCQRVARGEKPLWVIPELAE